MLWESYFSAHPLPAWWKEPQIGASDLLAQLGVCQPYWRIDLIGAKRMVKAFIPHYSFLNPSKTFENLTLAQRFCHPGTLAVRASAWDRATSSGQVLQDNLCYI